MHCLLVMSEQWDFLSEIWGRNTRTQADQKLSHTRHVLLTLNGLGQIAITANQKKLDMLVP